MRHKRSSSTDSSSLAAWSSSFQQAAVECRMTARESLVRHDPAAAEGAYRLKNRGKRGVEETSGRAPLFVAPDLRLRCPSGLRQALQVGIQCPCRHAASPVG